MHDSYMLRKMAPEKMKSWDYGELTREVSGGSKVLNPGSAVLFSQGIGQAIRIWEPTVGQLIVPSNWVFGIDESNL